MKELRKKNPSLVFGKYVCFCNTNYSNIHLLMVIRGVASHVAQGGGGGGASVPFSYKAGEPSFTCLQI